MLRIVNTGPVGPVPTEGRSRGFPRALISATAVSAPPADKLISLDFSVPDGPRPELSGLMQVREELK
jgi:hypothetical protein